MAGSEWVTAVGANRIIRIVLNGLNGPITVKGQQYSGTAMLAWKDTLNDEEECGFDFRSARIPLELEH